MHGRLGAPRGPSDPWNVGPARLTRARGCVAVRLQGPAQGALSPNLLGSEVPDGQRESQIVTALEPASFEVERFALDGNSCLEVRGRWFGGRGPRFMRPTLTAVADGREQRMLAVLDHKPWVAEEGET